MRDYSSITTRGYWLTTALVNGVWPAGAAGLRPPGWCCRQAPGAVSNCPASTLLAVCPLVTNAPFPSRASAARQKGSARAQPHELLELTNKL